jgi:hypothetical protein
MTDMLKKMWKAAYVVKAQITKLKDMNALSRRNLYQTCIRGGPNSGQELWANNKGVTMTKMLQAAYQIMKMIIGVYRRPATSAVMWLMRLHPFDQVAKIRQLEFVLGIMAGGKDFDTESAALEELKKLYLLKDRGWWKEVVDNIEQLKFMETENEFMKESLRRDGEVSISLLRKAIKARTEESSEVIQQAVAESSTHEFLFQCFPQWTDNRPLRVMCMSSRWSRHLTRWLLAEHNLESEQGRFKYRRLKKDCAFCRRCVYEGNYTVDDERHSLSECYRALSSKRLALAEILDMLEHDDIEYSREIVYLYEVIPEIQKLDDIAQFQSWKLIGKAITLIEKEIKTQDEGEKQGTYQPMWQ